MCRYWRQVCGAVLCCCLWCSWGLQATAENVSVHFRDTEVATVLQEVARSTQWNIAVDESVRGKVTVDLEDVTLDELLQSLSGTGELTYFYTENTIVVTAAKHAKFYTEGMTVFQPGHVFVDDIKESLSGLFEPGRVIFDGPTNTIFLLGGVPEVGRMHKALAVLDRASEQVTLKAQVYALSHDDSKRLGVNWDWDKIPQRDDRDSGDADSDDDDRNYGGKFRFWRGYNFRFAASLNALVAKGRAKLLATPSLVVVNGREGRIFVGEKIPVRMEKHDTSGRYDTTDYVDVGVNMQFRPLISSDRELVTLKTKLEVGTPTLVSELNNYKITSRGTETLVRIGNGRTMVIGGLINEEEQRNLQKVPLLSSIPLFGELFKHRTKVKSRMEVIMLLTPYVNVAGESPNIFDLEQLDKSIMDEKLK